MTARFEDRLTGRARALSGARERVCAWQAAELPAVFDRIQRARDAGRWVALLADYELGEWLVPESQRPPQHHDVLTRPPSPQSVSMQSATTRPAAAQTVPTPSARSGPRLTALIYEHASDEAPWQPPPDDDPAAIVNVTPMIERTDYLTQVQDIRDMIGRGELYQLNVTFPLHVDIQGTSESLYRRLANRHPSAHAAYVEDDGRTVLSFSPELFIARHGARLTTRPMKGTAPRMTGREADEAAGQALLDSPKDRAENLMIVDLLRNDLGRLARPGGVSVDALFTLEQYPSVWTLTSTISADLPGTPLPDVLASLFPCGSITGAPKVAAMRLIRAMEAFPRGLYCGAVGWLAPGGDFSLNVAIRTLVLDHPQQGRYSVGGGIVFDSSPEMEWEECLWKARVLTR